jgi:hypothetical protein
MSILDDAIREHLELKRAHGADDAELKKLEDEAFGPPARPGDHPLAEAPTEFLAAPGMDAEQAAAEAQGEGGRRAPNITDLQEPPPVPAKPETAEPAEEPSPSIEQTMPVPHPEGEGDAAPEDSAPAEDAPAPAAEIDSGPTTEERHAIAEQPTEFFDVEADLGAGSEAQSPTDEELIDSKLSEPRLAPVDPPSGIEATGPDAEVAGAPFADEDEEDDDFFSEQRLSDELNNALETPVEDEDEVFSPNVTPPSDEQALPPVTDEHAAFPATDEHEAGPFTDEHDALGTDEHEAMPPSDERPLPPVTDEHETGPYTDEHEAVPTTDEHAAFPVTDEHEAEPPSEEPTAIYNVEAAHEDDEDDFDDDEEDERKPAPPSSSSSEHEDVLEDTPDFLEDAPEDDNLWFEQQPPKDFDFDD